MNGYVKAKVIGTDNEVIVRQRFAGSTFFADALGNEYDITELSLTGTVAGDAIEYVKELFDTEAFERRRARMEEEKHWRELRASIFCTLVKCNDHLSFEEVGRIARNTEEIFNELHGQHERFLSRKR